MWTPVDDNAQVGLCILRENFPDTSVIYEPILLKAYERLGQISNPGLTSMHTWQDNLAKGFYVNVRHWLFGCMRKNICFVLYH